MRIPFSLCVLLLLGTSAWAQDDEVGPYYLQVNLGGVFSEKAEVQGFEGDFDPGIMTSIALGRHLWSTDRLVLDGELEAYYQYFTFDDVLNVPSAGKNDDARAFAFLVNGLLEWRFTRQFSVYGGAGVGYAPKIEYDTFDSGNLNQDQSDGFCFSGRLGLDYNLGGNYDFRFGYRYFRTEPIDIVDAAGSDELSIGQHAVELGVRWAL